MDDFNPYAAPETSPSPQHLTPEADEGRGVWRDGKILVISKIAPLPSRCIKCNEPATYRLTLIVGDGSKIQVPLCERHRARRSRGIRACWIAGLSGISLVFVQDFTSNTAVLGVGAVLVYFGWVFGALSLRVVTPTATGEDHVWLGKVGPLYLASLPPLPGGDGAVKERVAFDEV